MPDMKIDDYTLGDEETIEITFRTKVFWKNTTQLKQKRIRVIKLPLLSSANGPQAYAGAIVDNPSKAFTKEEDAVCDALEKLHKARDNQQKKAAYLELIKVCDFFTGKPEIEKKHESSSTTEKTEGSTASTAEGLSSPSEIESPSQQSPKSSLTERSPSLSTPENSSIDAKHSTTKVPRSSFMAKCGLQLQSQARKEIEKIESAPPPGSWWQQFLDWVASFFADEEVPLIRDPRLDKIAANALEGETPDNYLNEAYKHRHPKSNEEKSLSSTVTTQEEKKRPPIDDYKLFTAYKESKNTDLKTKISHSCLGIRFYQSPEREQKFFNLPTEDRFDTLLRLLDLYQVANAFEFLKPADATEDTLHINNNSSMDDIKKAIESKKLEFTKKYGEFEEVIGATGEGHQRRKKNKSTSHRPHHQRAADDGMRRQELSELMDKTRETAAPDYSPGKTKDEIALDIIEELLLNKEYLAKYRQWLPVPLANRL